MEERRILKRLSKALDDDNKDQQVILYHKLGELRSSESKPDDALEAFKNALDVCKKLKHKMRIGCAHRMVGEAYVDLNKFDKGLKHQKMHLEIAEGERDFLEQQRAWATIGRTQFCWSEALENDCDLEKKYRYLAAAKNAYTKSLGIINTHLGDLKKYEIAEMKARLMLNLGLVLENQGERDEARARIQTAIELCRAQDLYAVLCRSLTALGSLYHRFGKFAQALKAIGEALEVAKRLSSEDKLGVTCDALMVQADAFFGLGDFQAAKHPLHKAYKLKSPCQDLRENVKKHLQIAVCALRAERELQEVDESDYLLRKKLNETIADCCNEVKALGKAVEFYRKMLEYSELLGETGKKLSVALVSVAETYKDNKQYDEALPYFEREQEIWSDNPKECCRSFMAIAEIHKLKQNFDEQLLALEKAREQAVLAESKILKLDVLNELAAYHRARGDPQSADEVENEVVILRGGGSDSEIQSSQDVGSSQDQQGNVWDDVNVSDLSSEASASDEEPTVTENRQLRKRGIIKIRKNEKGETSLHTACIKGNLDQIRQLLKQKHPVNIRDHAGWTPLHEAANLGFVDACELLLNAGANVNDKGGRESDGMTPLLDAARSGRMEVMETLLERGADVTALTFKKPRMNVLDHFEIWHRELDSPLDVYLEEQYQRLHSRLQQAMERAGMTLNDNSQSLASKQARHGSTSLSEHSRGPSPILDDPARQRYNVCENRALLKIKRGIPLRIASTDPSSQSEDERGNRAAGTLRRKVDYAKRRNRLEISEDDDDAREIAESQEPLVREDRRQSSSDSEDEVEPIPSTSSGIRSRPSTSRGSVREYADVMETIRGKHRGQSGGPGSFIRPEKLPALVPCEVADMEWLEDDMPVTQSHKRRKLGSPTRSISMRTRRASQSTTDRRTSNDEREAQVRTPSPIDIFDAEEADGDADIDDECPPSPPRRKITPIKRSPAKSPRKTFSPMKPTQILRPTQRSSEQFEMGSVKVRIEDLLLLVPVPLKDLNISWLADEAAQRYYRLRNMKPKLTLMTKDGALLSPEDPISLVLSTQVGETPEVLGKVEKMTLPPITSRYKEACQTGNCEEDECLKESLESCQVTFRLMLVNLNMEPQFGPLFHALNLQQTLQELQLCGCALGDMWLERLCPVLTTLEQLTVLDLSCNNLSNGGLLHLKKLTENDQHLKGLIYLNLSHNLLGSEGLNTLGAMLGGLPALQKLNLQGCDLKLGENVLPEFMPSFILDNLLELNISHNPLGCSGLGYFFARVDAWKLRHLNVSFTISDSQAGENSSPARETALLLQRAMQEESSGGHLKKLQVSGCKLDDSDVYELLRALSESNFKVDHLDISCNPSITGFSLQYLLKHSPTIQSITLTGCPMAVCSISAFDIPSGLTSLKVTSVTHGFTSNKLTSLIQGWKEAKQFRARHRKGPGGLVHFSVV